MIGFERLRAAGAGSPTAAARRSRRTARRPQRPAARAAQRAPPRARPTAARRARRRRSSERRAHWSDARARSPAGSTLRSRRSGERATRSSASRLPRPAAEAARLRADGRATSETPDHRHAPPRARASSCAPSATRRRRASRAATRARARRMLRAAAGAQSAAAPPWSTVSAASDRHDEIGLDEQPGATRRVRRVDREPAEVVVLDVVDDDRAAEVARATRAEERLELAAAGSPAEPAGDEHRLTLGWARRPRELVQRRPRARSRRGSSSTAGSGSDGVSTTTVAPAAARRERPSGCPASGNRSASATAAATSASGSSGGGGEEHRLVGQRDEHEARAGEERHGARAVSSTACRRDRVQRWRCAPLGHRRARARRRLGCDRRPRPRPAARRDARARLGHRGARAAPAAAHPAACCGGARLAGRARAEVVDAVLVVDAVDARRPRAITSWRPPSRCSGVRESVDRTSSRRRSLDVGRRRRVLRHDRDARRRRPSSRLTASAVSRNRAPACRASRHWRRSSGRAGRRSAGSRAAARRGTRAGSSRASR